MGAAMAELMQASRAEKCRNTAETLRLLARKTRFPEIRDDLLVLAVGFERLADRMEARETTATNAVISA